MQRSAIKRVVIPQAVTLRCRNKLVQLHARTLLCADVRDRALRYEYSGASEHTLTCCNQVHLVVG
jgi:hypothetical protein